MKTIRPFRLNHEIQANASKSDAQRCLILAAFSSKPSLIHGLDESEDVLSMKRCLSEIGAEFHGTNPLQVLPIRNRDKRSLTLNVGESGFALRTIAFMSLVCSEDVTLHGTGTLLQREQQQLITILKQLGLDVNSNEGKLPLHIRGKVAVSEISVDGSAGSQAISGLCLLAPHLPNGLQVHIEKLKSKPYLDLTLQRMRSTGIHLDEVNSDTFFIPNQSSYDTDAYHIEGDWSGAANFIVGAAISGSLRIAGLQATSMQADRCILNFIQSYGAALHWKEKILHITEAKTKTAFQATIEDCPDLFPILVVLACSAKGTSIIHGVERLKNKESDRLLVMCELLLTFGVRHELHSNELHIHGTGKVLGGLIQTHFDHRIAMAASIAGSISENDILLSDEHCVAKSYPNFFNDLGF